MELVSHQYVGDYVLFIECSHFFSVNFLMTSSELAVLVYFKLCTRMLPLLMVNEVHKELQISAMEIMFPISQMNSFLKWPIKTNSGPVQFAQLKHL
jgi:hypothetical protein